MRHFWNRHHRHHHPSHHRLLQHTMLRPLFLLLLVTARVRGDAVRAKQSDTRSDWGSVFPSAMVYDAQNHHLKLLENVEHIDEEGETTMRCSYRILSSLTLRPKGQKNFGGMSEESCQNLVSDAYDSNTYVVGRSRLEGILQDYEGNGGDFDIPDDTEYYGMLLDLTNKKEEDEQVEVDLHGGVIVRGPKVVYTVAVASDNSTVYTASLHSESTKVILGPESNDEGSNSTLYAQQNPSQAFPMGSEFEMVIEAYAKTEYSSKLTSYDNETMFGKAFNAPTWNHPFIAKGRNATIYNVAGILVGKDALIVAGSDLGIGTGLGVADSADKTDYDGFVTKLTRTTGELYGDAEETAGLPTSYRLQTGEGNDDYILGLCPGDSHEIVYLTGSTTGNVKGGEDDSSSDGSTRAFLIKLNITSMREEWGIELGAVLPENTQH